MGLFYSPLLLFIAEMMDTVVNKLNECRCDLLPVTQEGKLVVEQTPAYKERLDVTFPMIDDKNKRFFEAFRLKQATAGSLLSAKLAFRGARPWPWATVSSFPKVTCDSCLGSSSSTPNAAFCSITTSPDRPIIPGPKRCWRPCAEQPLWSLFPYHSVVKGPYFFAQCFIVHYVETPFLIVIGSLFSQRIGQVDVGLGKKR